MAAAAKRGESSIVAMALSGENGAGAGGESGGINVSSASMAANRINRLAMRNGVSHKYNM